MFRYLTPIYWLYVAVTVYNDEKQKNINGMTEKYVVMLALRLCASLELPSAKAEGSSTSGAVGSLGSSGATASGSATVAVAVSSLLTLASSPVVLSDTAISSDIVKYNNFYHESTVKIYMAT